MPTTDRPRTITRALTYASRAVGSRWAAAIVTTAVLGYLVVGAVTGFGHSWQIAIHTTAAMVTLPMLFVLQHTTNRETRAILIKLDELISADSEATEKVMGIEDHEIDDQEKIEDRLHSTAD
ncbi:MAG: low affinity iron permease family protein [Mycolicibacterium cosmeticum]|nr:low affinity iron permease family protein [Mycolicibacterium cosmeticum]